MRPSLKSLFIPLAAGAGLTAALIAQPATAARSPRAVGAAALSGNIVFVTHNSNVPCDDPSNTVPCHVAVMNLDGVGQQVTNGTGNDVDPSWSPDGTKVAFARKLPGDRYHIWVMNSNGSGQKQLTSGPGNERYPSWSPDGTRIAYRGYPSATGGSEIFVMSASGTGSQPLPHTFGADQPVWSPDGKRIAYTDAGASGTAGDADIYAITVDDPAAQPQDLTPGSPTTSDRYPSWYPNGKAIAFRRLDSSGSGRELWQINCANVDCTNEGSPPVTDLTTKLGPGRAGTWSPDARGLTFVSFRKTAQNPEGDAEIFVGSVDGSFPTKQLTQNTVLDDEPHWANVPVSSSPAPPSSGGTVPTSTGSGATSGVTPGGTLPNGKPVLTLRWRVPRQSLGRRHFFVVTAGCNLRCSLSATGTARVQPSGKKARRLSLFRARRALRANRTYRVRVRIPGRTLRAIRATFRHHRRVTVVFVLTARTSSGQFTPSALARLVVRR